MPRRKSRPGEGKKFEKWRKEHPEEFEKMKQENRERMRAMQKKFIAEHPERFKEIQLKGNKISNQIQTERRKKRSQERWLRYLHNYIEENIKRREIERDIVEEFFDGY